MSEYYQTLELPSDISQLSVLEEEIDALVEKGLISDEVYGNVLVAATEAFMNAVNHGNKNQPDKIARIELSIHDDQLEICVHDEGKGFDHESLPDPTDPKNIEKANGRGIFIIKNLADEVDFDRNGATLKMSFKLNVKELVEV